MASQQTNVSETASAMFSKLLSYQQGNTGNGAENTPLLPSGAAGAANQIKETGTQVVNETVQKISKLNESAPYSFRVLAFVGGLAMIVSNILHLLGRALTLQITGTIVSCYLILFGIIIVMLEADTVIGGASIQEIVRYYAKFLEFSWGRGMLYFFVGTLQVANWNLVDWIVGGFMMFVGITAILAGIKTANDLKQLRVAIRNEQDLRDRWNKHDKDGNGYLGIDELTAFINDAGITMSQNEVVSAYMALNKKFDDKLSYDELVQWWANPSAATGTSV